MKNAAKPQKRNIFTRIEPILQHEGFAYTFSLIYILANVVFFLIGAAPQWRRVSFDSPFMKIVQATARGAGSVLNLNSALVILVASKIFMSAMRRTPLNMVVPFDKAMPQFHAYIGTTIAIATFLHAVPHLINYAVNNLNKTGIHGHASLAISGCILCIVIGVMRLTSTRTIRLVISYETWYIIHISGFVLFFALLILHGSHYGSFSTYKFVSGPLALYAVDIFLRRFRNHRKAILVPGQSATTVGEKILRLRMARTFEYLPGQYCYINVPSISKYQWHPFSIASSPHESHIVFYIKVNGDWTSELYKMCAADATMGCHAEKIAVYARGPFGAPAQHVGQYEHVILISGGVGATPFTSITKYAHHWIANHLPSGYATASSTYDAYNINYGAHTNSKPVNSRFTAARIAQPYENMEQISEPTYPIELDPSERNRALDATFLSRASAAANSTFISLRRTLKNAAPKSLTRYVPADFSAALGDPNGPIPDRHDMQDPYVNDSARGVFFLAEDDDFNFVNEDTIIDARQLEADIIKEQLDTPSRAIHLIGTRPSARNQKTLNISGVRESDKEIEDKIVSWKDKFLVVMHSVTLNWVLLWMMFLRFVLVGIGRITHSFALKQRGLSIYGEESLNVMDLVLSVVLFVPVGATIASEMAMYGVWEFFYRDLGNGFDFFLLLPLSFMCVLLHVLGLANIGNNSHHVSKIIVLAIWPLLSIFLVWRIVRTIGSRVTIARYFRSRMAHTKSLDFLWVNRTHEEDSWLIRELLPIANSEAVRVHRFLTKSEPVVEDWMRDYAQIPLKTTYGRPNWDKVFQGVVEKSRSGSVIGVFFCGPHKMARVVQRSAMNAMQKSIKNAFERGYDEGGRINSSQNKSKNNDDEQADAQFETTSWGGDSVEATGKAAYGCNIRISVRVENFS